MNYILKSGVLYKEPNVHQAKMKSEIVGSVKKIFHINGTLAIKTEIRHLDDTNRSPGDVRTREYVMIDSEGIEIGVAKPDYAPENDPLIIGWPICRMPRVDRANVLLGDSSYTLSMLNSQNYTMKDAAGQFVVQIVHWGLTGGWNIEADEHFSAEILCGLFAFCRYIEQENELLII